jgi:TPR repeat protein
VHGDVRSPGGPAQQQEREASADRWAAAKLLQLGIDPALASLSMLALNTIEKTSPLDRTVASHPPPLLRAMALVLASERVALDQPAWIERYLAPTGPPGELAARVQAYRAALQRMRTTYAKAIADERRLESDNSFLLQRASAGATKERIALAGLLATGERAGLPKDLAQARAWMQRAITESAPYEFDYRTDAQFQLGLLELAPGGDKATACAALRQAAAVKHLVSGVYLGRVVRDGVC